MLCLHARLTTPFFSLFFLVPPLSTGEERVSRIGAWRAIMIEEECRHPANTLSLRKWDERLKAEHELMCGCCAALEQRHTVEGAINGEGAGAAVGEADKGGGAILRDG